MKNLFRYDAEYNPGNRVEETLNDWGVRFDSEQMEAALEAHFRSRIVLKYVRDNKNRPHWTWRLTFPLWAITWLLLITIVCPINWVATGNYALDDKSRIFSWVKPWYRKLFP